MSYYPVNHGTRFLDPLLDELFGARDDFLSENHGSLSMRTDLAKEDGGFVMMVDLPGVKKEDISLSYENEQITIRVKINTLEKNEKGENKLFIRRERFSGSASRSYYVGDIDESKIKASYADGVLRVFFPEEKPIENASHSIAIN